MTVHSIDGTVTLHLASGPVNFKLALEENETTKALKKGCPISSKIHKWGDEIYFPTGIVAPVQKTSVALEIGDIAYWPEGKCICIFYGPTPSSTSERPQAASGVQVIGKISASPQVLRTIEKGTDVVFSFD